MQHLFSLSASSRVMSLRQASALLLLGALFLVLAWMGMLNSYSMGVLLFGLGMLGVAPFNPRRFLSIGWLTTSLVQFQER